MTGFTGKVALVTGGSRGIGLEVARALAERGATVAITATSSENLRRAQETLHRAAPEATLFALRADVRRYEEVEEAITSVVDRAGGLDILVNNAGIGIFKRVDEMSRKDWNAIIDTNLTGVFNCCQAALPHLKRRGESWIINISSLASANSFPEAAAYCASKAGLNAFSEALMQEVRHDGVRVAYVMPGSVRTEFGGRALGGDEWKLAPSDVAQVVVDLIAHPARSLPSRVEIRPARPPKKR